MKRVKTAAAPSLYAVRTYMISFLKGWMLGGKAYDSSRHLDSQLGDVELAATAIVEFGESCTRESSIRACVNETSPEPYLQCNEYLKEIKRCWIWC
jgi:hypothetical protein